jgi:hypothetical protein
LVPLFPKEIDFVLTKPKYNYALVLADEYSRWPKAYPLKSLSAKATCDTLLPVFLDFAVPKIVNSDCGFNFTA